MVVESGQLDVVDLLESQVTAVQDALANLDTTLRPQIDANPDDNILMDLLGYVDDAEEAMQGLLKQLEIIRHRDEREAMPPLQP